MTQLKSRLNWNHWSQFALAGLTVLALLASPAAQVQAAGTTYYVDSVAGNDANNGTSTSTPWQTLTKVNGVTFQPGDQLLFKSGSLWTGTLAPQGSESAAAPIVISNYGTGNLPLIAGAGASDTVYLFNQQYWEINNLEITNDTPSSSDRRGVHVVGQNAGQLNHIYLRGLNVHNVNGSTNKNQGASAGILIEVIDPTTVTTWFNDVLIENNRVVTVNRLGINTWSEFFQRTLDGTYRGGPWTPFTNVVIQNNYLSDIGGDGIAPHMTIGALVQNNVLDGFNRQSLTDAKIVSAGMWAYDADNALFQYNEGFHGHTNNDGMAWDVDSGTQNHIYQYNYSHDNDGGFELVCDDATHNGISQNHITRYNISQNDGNTRIWRFCGIGLQNMQFYNNTFYIGPTYSSVICVTCYKSTNAYWWNNIFYDLSTATSWGDTKTTVDVFDYNLFYGNHPVDEPPDPHKITADPRLTAPGTGGNGINTLNGYKLLAGSPAIGSGTIIQNNGGKDFWGNPVPANCPPDRGANQLSSPTCATPTPGPTATNSPTATSVPPTATSTPTNTPAPTNTPGGPTATNTPIPPTATRTATPTVTNTPAPTATAGGSTVMHVADLLTTDVNGTPQSVFTGGDTVYWRVQIVDQSGNPVNTAAVTTALLKPDGSTWNTQTHSTGADGWVVMQKSTSTSSPKGVYTINVTNVTKTGATYDPAANVKSSTTFTLQ